MLADLIPGLPDEIALDCLLRVQYDQYRAVRSVCKLWKQELEAPLFLGLRKSSGLARTVVVLTQAEPSFSDGGPAKKYAASTPSYRLVLFEPEFGAWAPLPPVPGCPHGLPLFCQLAGVGRELVVLGGWDPETWAALDCVHIYDFVAGLWRRGTRMPGPRRSFFACAAAPGGAVLVAGGHDEEKNALRSALAYDVATDRWAALPDMIRERDECKGLFLNGAFHVVGGYSTEMQGRFGRSAESFDLSTWRWTPVEEDKLEASVCPRTCVAGGDGRLYMCQKPGQLVALDGGAWRGVADLPEDARVAPQAVALKDKLLVMGSGSHGGAQAAYVLNVAEGKAATWSRANVPAEYSGHVQAVCCLEI